MKFDLNRSDARILIGASALTMMIFATGCGSNPGAPVQDMVQDVSLKTYTQETDQWAEMQISLSTSNFQFASFFAPVVNPKNDSIVYGSLSIAPRICSQCDQGGDITINLNITQVSRLEGMNPKLPNGTPLPVSGLGNATVVALPVASKEKTSARIYFAFDENIAMLGTALTFAELDPAGDYVPGINFFYPVKIKETSLLAGFFTGRDEASTGIGLFADLSGLLNSDGGFVPSASLLASSQQQSKSRINRSGLRFRPRIPSQFETYHLYRVLDRLNRKGPTLHLR